MTLLQAKAFALGIVKQSIVSATVQVWPSPRGPVEMQIVSTPITARVRKLSLEWSAEEDHGVVHVNPDVEDALRLALESAIRMEIEEIIQ